MLGKSLLYLVTGVTLVFIMGGCYGFDKKRLSQESIFVVWKSPVMKYADQGFLYRDGDGLRLEIYANGQAVMRLTIKGDRICKGALCMDKKSFNMRYLSPNYPDRLLENILEGREIFDSRGVRREKGVLVQKIAKKGAYDIEYSSGADGTVFVDPLNHISIKIKKNG